MRLTDLQYNFNKKLEHLTTINPLSKSLGQWRRWVGQGANQTQQILEELKDSIDNPKVHEAFAHIQALLSPYLSSLGIRLTRLSKQSVEILIPGWWRTKDSEHQIDEGVLVSAAKFACLQLIKQSPLFSHLPCSLIQIEIQMHSGICNSVHGRVEWTDIQQEAHWALLRESGKSAAILHVGFFDEYQRKMAEASLGFEFQLKESLAHSSSSRDEGFSEEKNQF